MKSKSFTTHKINDPSTNEDAVRGTPNFIAVSDGAGGCGIFAERWSQYLVDNLSACSFGGFDVFNQWIDSIWEPFYNEIESELDRYDKFVGNKFQKEGSYATLAVVWHTELNINYCYYGDSSIFVFDTMQDEMLFMSAPDIATYDKSPCLINWKDLPIARAYHQGALALTTNQHAFVASDSLSCFITMAYYAAKQADQINQFTETTSKLSAVAQSMKVYMEDKSFYKDILLPLFSCDSNADFRALIASYVDMQLILDDDFSLCLLTHNACNTQVTLRHQQRGLYRKYRKAKKEAKKKFHKLKFNL